MKIWVLKALYDFSQVLNINEGQEIYMNYLGLEVIETESAKSTNGTSKFVFKIYFSK